ncbi:MAG TPA: hypothetical protein VN063_07505 [Methylophilaceae bacterium]|nr:hypothetical protein [Methylophilaceae bacterium]
MLATTGWLATQGWAEPDLDTTADSAETMVWPMLPGESVNQLAALFYPGDKAMQRRFADRTRVLSAAMAPTLDPATPFAQAAVIVIPDIKALSRQAHGFTRASTPRRDKLRMSYQIAEAGSVMVTPQMEAEYESLSQRNRALKDNLQKLNARLAELQLKMAAMLGQGATGSASTAGLDMPAPQRQPVAQSSLPAPATQPVSATVRLAPSAVPDPANTSAAAVASPAKAVSAIKPLSGSVRPSQPATSQPQGSVPLSASYWWDDDLKGLLMQFAMLLLGLILALFAWRWLRKQLAKKITEATDEQLDGLRKNTFSADESGFFNTQQPYHVADDMGVLSVEEFDSVVDEARILVSMDRINEAISLLRQHLDEQPRSSLQPWVYLLDLYRTLDRQEAFTELAKRFHLAFNVMAPQWEQKQIAMVVATTLEEFPHIIDQLQSMWPNPESRDYLEALIKDNREGERAGFSIEVAKEIALLISILETRDS